MKNNLTVMVFKFIDINLMSNVRVLLRLFFFNVVIYGKKLYNRRNFAS
jgi:hypothetical protein